MLEVEIHHPRKQWIERDRKKIIPQGLPQKIDKRTYNYTLEP